MCRGNDAENPIPPHPLISVSRFLLVSLNIDSILQESTIYRRRERLRKMTDGLELGDAYGAMVERIMAQSGDKSRLGMEALMWVSHAERPLSADEVCHALAVELGSTQFNAGNVPSMSTLVTCCQGLITVDKEESTVRLIHFTLKEYLSAHPDIFNKPHSTMAEICLTYLDSEQVRVLSSDDTRHILEMPFQGYCSLYWGVHAKRELSDYARSLAIRLLQKYDGHISAKSLLRQVKHLIPWYRDTSFPFSGLHCASFFGLSEVVATLIEMGSYNIDARDLWGFTPLAWAARNGHEEMVKILLGQEEANPDKPDNCGCTPLSHAARNGHAGVVKILLEWKEVNPDKADYHGNTPLSWAAWNGHEHVVKILLGREEVTPDKPDNDGDTPLNSAAYNGHEGVAKALLEQEGVNPDRQNNAGRTPLCSAAANGHEGVIKILLARGDVNPDKLGNRGNTPLLYAAQNGHAGVVKILLEWKEVNPDKADNHGNTPLSWAAWNGHEQVVKILLGREGHSRQAG